MKFTIATFALIANTKASTLRQRLASTPGSFQCGEVQNVSQVYEVNGATISQAQYDAECLSGTGAEVQQPFAYYDCAAVRDRNGHYFIGDIEIRGADFRMMCEDLIPPQEGLETIVEEEEEVIVQPEPQPPITGGPEDQEEEKEVTPIQEEVIEEPEPVEPVVVAPTRQEMQRDRYVAMYDRDQDGCITWNEFNSRSRLPEWKNIYFFNHIDSNSDGCKSRDEVLGFMNVPVRPPRGNPGNLFLNDGVYLRMWDEGMDTLLFETSAQDAYKLCSKDETVQVGPEELVECIMGLPLELYPEQTQHLLHDEAFWKVLQLDGDMDLYLTQEDFNYYWNGEAPPQIFP